MSVVDSDSEVRILRPSAKRQRWLVLDPPPATTLAPPEPTPLAAAPSPEPTPPAAVVPPPAAEAPPLPPGPSEGLSNRPIVVSVAPPPVAIPPLPHVHTRSNPLLRLLAALRMRIAVPAWLVSLVLHLTALIALGLWTIPLRDTTPQTLIVAISQPESEALEALPEIIFTPPPETYDEVAIDAPATSLTELQTTAEAAAASAGGANAIEDVAFEAANPSDILGSGGAAMRTIGSGAAYSAEFFGVKAQGRRFVFIVDASGSMQGEKFIHAKEELMYAVRRLDKSQSFYVIFFNSGTYRMFEDNDTPPEERPIAATTSNIRRLALWLKGVEAQTQTNPRQAVQHALEVRPDAIYILSDGEFTDGGMTEQFLATENIMDDPVDGPRPRVVIHTIGFYSKSGEPALQAIAKAYGGVYRFIGAPLARRR